MAQTYTYQQIGQRIRERNPEAFTNINSTDEEIGKRAVERKPELQSIVSVPEEHDVSFRYESPTSTKPKEEKGFLRTMGEEIVRPFAKFGVSAAKAAQGAYGLAKAGVQTAFGNKEAAKQTIKETGERVNRAVDLPFVGETKAVQKPSDVIGTGLDIGTTIFGGGIGAGAVKGGFKGAVKTATKEAIKYGVPTAFASGVSKELQEEDPTLSGAFKKGLAGAAGAFAVAPIIAGAGSATGKLFGRSVKKANSAEELIENASKILDEPSSKTILGRAQVEAPKVTIREKWAGISPDIKKRIQGKQDKLQTYFDVAHARNLDDTLPTPLEHAADNVMKAEREMDRVLRDTGSDIGRFRQKIGGLKINQETVNSAVDLFDDELSKLDLRVDARGVIKQRAGTQVALSDTEVRTLQLLRDNLRKLKANPTVMEVIKSRMIFDDRINFAKSSREASSVIDPISRTMRSKLAEINRNTIGKTESAKLKEFETIIDGLKELRSYSQRRAGAEFLLKRVLSERGGAPRELIALLKKYTGVDLMDDATMASIATDLIGNSRQKGLFRQEIEKAGLDVAALLRGDAKGILNTFLNMAKDQVVDPERAYLEAAKRPSNFGNK